MKFISDFNVGDKVKIVCAAKNKRVSFDKDVKEVILKPEIGAKAIVTDLVIVDGKYVDFDGFRLLVEGCIEGELCNFNIQKTIYDTKKNKFILFSNKYMQKINKRRAQRYQCNYTAEIICKNKSLKGVCKDISTVGAKYVCADAKEMLTVGAFIDAYINVDKKVISTQGTVVRIKRENGRSELGINFLQSTSGIMSTVNKLRKKMSKAVKR